MDDDLPFACYITKRGRIYQQARRVPEDLTGACPVARVQRSLHTSDHAPAYRAGAHVRAEIEKQFAALRTQDIARANACAARTRYCTSRMPR